MATRELRSGWNSNFEEATAMASATVTDYHWNDHAGRLAKIRQAAGLPEAK